MAGRGSGKTRAAAEYVHRRVRFTAADRAYTKHHEPARYVTLIAPTAAATRDVMVLGESGLQHVADDLGIRFRYKSSWGHVEWPDLGVTAVLYSAEEARSLRGPQSDLTWAEEIASWRDAWRGDELDTTWNNMTMGLRLGQRPVCVVTGTPKPVLLVKQLVELSKDERNGVVITTGSTYDNEAHLAPTFFRSIVKHEGTRIGRQEIYAQLLEDVEGALWVRTWIEQHRVPLGPWWEDWLSYSAAPVEVIGNVLGRAKVVRRVSGQMHDRPPGPLPTMVKMAVGIDPSASSSKHADEAGVVVAGLGDDGHSYVFDDRSDVMGPLDWSSVGVAAYHEWIADKIVAEKNNGGDMVRITIAQQDPTVAVDLVWASRGKAVRAEPVATLYREGRVHHVGAHPALEDQLCSWVPGYAISPGRLDALVWVLSYLHDLSPARAGRNRQFYSQ